MSIFKKLNITVNNAVASVFKACSIANFHRLAMSPGDTKKEQERYDLYLFCSFCNIISLYLKLLCLFHLRCIICYLRINLAIYCINNDPRRSSYELRPSRLCNRSYPF